MGRRFFLGIGILVVLLALGFGVSIFMEQVHQPICACLEQAARAGAAGEPLAREARDRWEQIWKVNASLSDHSPMEQIDSLFGRLESLARQEQWVLFSAACLELSQLIQAMPEAHGFSWWSIL